MYDITPVLTLLEEFEGDPRYLSQRRMAEVFGLTKKETKRILEAGVADDYAFDKMCVGLGYHPQEIIGIDNWINPVLGYPQMETTPETPNVEAEAEAALQELQASLDWIMVEEDTPSFDVGGVFVFAETDEEGRVVIHVDSSQYDAEYDEAIEPWRSNLAVVLNGYVVYDGITHEVVPATWNPEAEAYEV